MSTKKETKQVLEKHGFIIDNESGVGDSYKMDLGNEWQISVFCSFVGNIFKGDMDKEQYESISASLFDSIGTKYKFKSIKSLDDNLDKIVKKLKEHSENDEILKCEKCKIRYVQPKEPPAGKRWKPFLSCSGMIIRGSGRNKNIVCDGTSRKLPAVVEV